MTKLEQLLADLCPNGVEYKTVQAAVGVNRGKRLTKSQLSEDGEYEVYHGSKDSILGKYNQYNAPANTTIVVNTGGIGGVKFLDKPFWCSDGSFWLGQSDSIDSKFLYYCLSGYEDYFYSQKRVGGVPTIDRSVVEDFKIPIPPLPVQSEIVRILDNFTGLTAELTAELTARKQQYAHYREKILSRTSNAEQLALQDIVADSCSISYGIVQTGDDVENGIPVVRPVDLTDKIVSLRGLKKVDPSIAEPYKRTILKGGDLLLCVRGTTGVISIASNELRGCNVSRGIVPLTFKSTVCPQYIYYQFLSQGIQKEIELKTRGAALKQINMEDLRQIRFPLPAFEVQQQIVSILDRFDSLCNDISVGLPAEIEARRKQYEYYRDKLLTFTEKTS